MDLLQSGPVFYQAVPAVGPDGKGIMKLIPVQRIKGKFFEIKGNIPKTDLTPQKAVPTNIPSALNPSAPPKVFQKQVSFVKASPLQASLDHSYSLNKHPLQQQTTVHLPSVATPAANSVSKSVRLSGNLPVTLRSPALPMGQYLQIPANAQILRLPGSELPPGIKEQIFTSSANSSPGAGLPSVVYVSPITTVNQGVTAPTGPAPHPLMRITKTVNTTPCAPPSTGSRPHLKLIPKASQRPNSPIKWTIEEEDSLMDPVPAPLISPSVTSGIIRAVAEGEKSGLQSDLVIKTVSQSRQGKNGHRQEDALVVCNGKVFFVAKKSCLPPKTGKSDQPIAATKSYEFNKTTLPSSQPSVKSVAAQTKQDLRIIIRDEPVEVIDLCDDDVQDASSQQGAATEVTVSAVTPPDEDNVIFVSYFPPKSDQTSQTGTGCSNGVAERKRPDGSTGVQQSSSSTQRLEKMEVDAGTKCPAEPGSSKICSPMEDIHNMEGSVNPTTSWTSSPSAKSSRQMDDHQLRQIFGITDDVKICLQRIEEASAGSVPAQPQQSEPIMSVEEPTSGSKEKELFPQGTDSNKALVTALPEQELSPDSTPRPHTHSEPFTWTHIQPNTKPTSALKNIWHSGQSPQKGSSCDVQSESMFGYVEPIDEDFLSTDENNIPDPKTHEDVNANTRRMGRTRRRTICPCCVPRAQVPARIKAIRKDVKTSGRISHLKDKNKQFWNTYGPLDSVMRKDQVRRLRELLKEKGDALKVIRNGGIVKFS